MIAPDVDDAAHRPACPHCKGAVFRVPRRFIDLLISFCTHSPLSLLLDALQLGRKSAQLQVFPVGAWSTLSPARGGADGASDAKGKTVGMSPCANLYACVHAA